MTPNQIAGRIIELNELLESLREEALARFNSFMPGKGLLSFHAHIGMYNNTFVDSVRTRFGGPEEFIAKWVHGLHASLDALRANGKTSYQGRLYGAEVVLRCLQDDVLRKYTLTFLERNFYRNYIERTRHKPDDALWSVWFGAGNLSWGLVIAPALRNNEWTNDKSQMRRERYTYWTIEHVLAAGLIDPDSPNPMRFDSLPQFVTFYRSVLKRVSVSPYEQAISDRYLDYLSSSRTPLAEPLLIPEFRYAGKEKKHEFRLDFTVLNGHTLDLTGFEISPASTHVSVKKAGEKTQTQLNAELREAWEHEMKKRNDYFQKFGVSVVTFTDSHLTDIDACFDVIRERLMARSTGPVSLDAALKSLQDSYGIGV
ncbi:topoisomerase II [Roseateles toxinivorans]|uniref:Uncharacterized protein n=1 Tax=Roseateles toxinivorans TaxID=270368 RepID=A0A4R6QFD1_9BURK|nr:topoisomerase II [Roseateles toxinivorans]TDP60653.1 hypothetical protein DES47_11575 [Roseateles toxinivorans]